MVPCVFQLAKTQGNVFATDAILATLMTATRSVYSWDIVVQRVGNKLFFDKRDDSEFGKISWHLLIDWLRAAFSSQPWYYQWGIWSGAPFYPLAFQAEGVLSLPASVHLSVCKLYLVRMITRHKFELESPNLHQTCIMGYSRLVLKMEVIDRQGHFGHFDSEF